MNICGILWNATGINNPKLKRFVQPSDNASDKEEWLKLLGTNTFNNDWNHIVRQAGVNAWIGSLEDKSITAVQTMPWNFRPWGCGSGVKGSCNNGWIQFIICEDSLTDKNYFNKIYKEACELTAYLCVLYKIDPKATVAVNSIEIPTILCDAEAHELQMGADHKDMFNWLNSFGKTMEDVRNDVFNLIEKATVKSEVKEIKKEVFKIRKNWEDAKSQIGVYENLEDAKKACDVAGEGYEVYNEKGILVYPEVAIEESKCDF